MYQSEEGLYSLLNIDERQSQSDSPRGKIDVRIFAESPRYFDQKQGTQIQYRAMTTRIQSDKFEESGQLIPRSPDMECLVKSTKKGRKFLFYLQSRLYPIYRFTYKMT